MSNDQPRNPPMAIITANPYDKTKDDPFPCNPNNPNAEWWYVIGFDEYGLSAVYIRHEDFGFKTYTEAITRAAEVATQLGLCYTVFVLSSPERK